MVGYLDDCWVDWRVAGMVARLVGERVVMMVGMWVEALVVKTVAQ
jgi:hypothetical protein